MFYLSVGFALAATVALFIREYRIGLVLYFLGILCALGSFIPYLTS